MMDAARMPLEDGQRTSSIFMSERNENHTEHPEVFLSISSHSAAPDSRAVQQSYAHPQKPKFKLDFSFPMGKLKWMISIQRIVRRRLSNGHFALKIGNKMKPTSNANPERGITSPIYLLVFFYL